MAAEDFPVHVRIINRTRWAIDGACVFLDEVERCPPVEIASHSVSEVVTVAFSSASPAVFHLHLVGLDLVGPDTEIIPGMGNATRSTGTVTVNSTILVRAPVKDYDNFMGEDYDSFDQVFWASPFVRVTLRYGTGQPTGADDWGSIYFSRTDERIGIDGLGMQVTITEQPAAKRFSVLTYNTHLFQDSPGDWGPKYLLKKLPTWLPTELEREFKRKTPRLRAAFFAGLGLIGLGACDILLAEVKSEIKKAYKEFLTNLEKQKPVVYMDNERQAELVRRLQSPLDPPDPELAWPPDIVCLQEVWGVDRQKALLDDLLKTYPYVYREPSLGLFPGSGSLRDWVRSLVRSGLSPYLGKVPKAVRALFGLGTFADGIADEVADDLANELRDLPGGIDPREPGGMNQLTNSSGLVIASRFRIFDPEFVPYEGATKQDDQMAKKGALTFRVRVPLNAGERLDALEVKIGTTHAYTPTPEALQNVELLARQTFEARQYTSEGPQVKPDALLLGDLNLCERRYYSDPREKVWVPDGEVGKEYTALVSAMSKWGAQEVVEGDHPGNYAAYYTDWNGGIKLTELMEKGSLPSDWNPDPNKRDRLDYVFFCPGDQQLTAPGKSHLQTLGPAGVRVFHDWTIKNEDGVDVEVSDHMPVLVELAVVPAVPEAEPSPAAGETKPTPQPVG